MFLFLQLFRFLIFSSEWRRRLRGARGYVATNTKNTVVVCPARRSSSSSSFSFLLLPEFPFRVAVVLCFQLRDQTRPDQTRPPPSSTRRTVGSSPTQAGRSQSVREDARRPAPSNRETGRDDPGAGPGGRSPPAFPLIGGNRVVWGFTATPGPEHEQQPAASPEVRQRGLHPADPTGERLSVWLPGQEMRRKLVELLQVESDLPSESPLLTSTLAPSQHHLNITSAPPQRHLRTSSPQHHFTSEPPHLTFTLASPQHRCIRLTVTPVKRIWSSDLLITGALI